MSPARRRGHLSVPGLLQDSSTLLKWTRIAEASVVTSTDDQFLPAAVRLEVAVLVCCPTRFLRATHRELSSPSSVHFHIKQLYRHYMAIQPLSVLVEAARQGVHASQAAVQSQDLSVVATSGTRGVLLAASPSSTQSMRLEQDEDADETAAIQATVALLDWMEGLVNRRVAHRASGVVFRMLLNLQFIAFLVCCCLCVCVSVCVYCC